MTGRQKLAILKGLARTKSGDLILDPAACADWIPTQYTDTAEGWTAAFDEIVIGDSSTKTMNKKTMAEYFKGLKEYQLAFWQAHAGKIKATVTEEIILDYEDSER